jgi:antitoxin component YwqK of YwqJK toxin-antitoxin module
MLTLIKEYRKNGAIYREYYIDKYKMWQGKSKVYYTNGQLATDGNWKNDQIHGEIIWYESSRLFKKIFFKNNFEFGQQKLYRTTKTKQT